MMMNRMKNAGIITLLIFSMPPDTPKISTAAVSRITRVCHGTLEKFVLLISVKNCSGSVLISEPVSAPNALRSTQPTMMA